MSNSENYNPLFLTKLPSFNYCFFILQLSVRIMNLLDGSSAITFGLRMYMKRLSDDLNELVGAGIWYIFKIRNTTRLWLVNNIVSVMKSDKVLCGVAGMCPGFVVGILNQVNEISFYVLCNETLKYSEYIEKCISSRKRTTPFMAFEGNYFKLSSSSGETIVITFETRYVEGKYPSALIFAYDLLNNTRLSSLAYVIVYLTTA
jgi:hypothetical protein